jgi:hypothetical protein
MANKHGGRRPGSGPKPKGKPWLQPVSSKFELGEIERIDKQRQPGESRAACVRRLVLEIIRIKEYRNEDNEDTGIPGRKSDMGV